MSDMKLKAENGRRIVKSMPAEIDKIKANLGRKKCVQKL